MCDPKPPTAEEHQRADALWTDLTICSNREQCITAISDFIRVAQAQAREPLEQSNQRLSERVDELQRELDESMRECLKAEREGAREALERVAHTAELWVGRFDYGELAAAIRVLGEGEET